MKNEPLLISLTDRKKSASWPGWRALAPRSLLMVLLLAANASVHAAWPGIRFTADRIGFEGSELNAITGSLDAAGNLEIGVDTAALVVWPGQLRALFVRCPLKPSRDGGFCPGGEFRLELPDLHREHAFSAVDGVIERLVSDRGKVTLVGGLATEGLEAKFTSEFEEEKLRIDLSWAGQFLLPLQNFKQAPTVSQWIKDGTSQGEIQLDVSGDNAPVITFNIQLGGLSFDSPEGLYAGEGLQLVGLGRFTLSDTISGQLSGSVSAGELLLGDFYRDFSDAAMAFEASPALEQSLLAIEEILLTDHSAFRMEGAAQLGIAGNEAAPSFTISNLELDFPGAYKRYFESMAAIFALDGLEMTGSVSWSGDWQEGAFQSGELVLKDLTIVDIEHERFAITGLDARMRPGDHEFDSSLTWRGLLMGPVNLGAAELKLDSAPGRIALSRPLELDVLGGQLAFETLAIELPGSIESLERDLDIELRAEIQSMDMELLSKAMGWPVFSGEISGVVPAVSLNEGVLSVDGEILFQVFDGSIALSDLRVERPFGVLPSLAANIDINDLDLEQVTHTFSFGQIGGRLDGYVHDLRMLDWKPVAFDAWLGTPERQEKSNDISRQAVNHLTTLGGGSATTALTGPIMKMFNNFSYRRLGLGCRLHNNICDLRGISEDENSVLIMEGAGIPKIMIQAFNRSLDFPQLVAGLTAVSGDEKIRIGD